MARDYQEFIFHGSQGEKLYFGSTDADFIGVGASIFLTITLLMFTVSNLIGHLPPTLLEVMTTLVGSVLMISAGALAVSFYSNRSRDYRYEVSSELSLQQAEIFNNHCRPVSLSGLSPSSRE